MKKFNTCPSPPILLPHMKFSKKSDFEWDPTYKIGQIWHQNGQKRPSHGPKKAIFQNPSPDYEHTNFFSETKCPLFFILAHFEQNAIFWKIWALKNTFRAFYLCRYCIASWDYAFRMEFGMQATGIRCKTLIWATLAKVKLASSAGW